MTDDENLVSKLTFEDCLKKQTKLRKKIMELITEDRCLKESERDEFFELLGRSTFGMGITKAYEITIPGEGVVSLGSVEQAARYIAIQEKNPVMLPRDSKTSVGPIGISVLWRRLLELLFAVFPVALDRASAMSKEREVTAGGTGYGFDPFQ